MVGTIGLRMWAMVAFVAMACLLVSTTAMSVQARGPQVLTPKNFAKATSSGKNTLVDFFSPSCPHCKSLAPTIASLSKQFSKSKDVTIATVNAAKYGQFADEQGVQGYPTIKWYDRSGAQSEVYKGNRDLGSLKSYIETKLGHKGTPSGAAKQKKAKDHKKKRKQDNQEEDDEDSDSEMDLDRADDSRDTDQDKEQRDSDSHKRKARNHRREGDSASALAVNKHNKRREQSKRVLREHDNEPMKKREHELAKYFESDGGRIPESMDDRGNKKMQAWESSHNDKEAKPKKHIEGKDKNARSKSKRSKRKQQNKKASKKSQRKQTKKRHSGKAKGTKKKSRRATSKVHWQDDYNDTHEDKMIDPQYV